MQEPTNWWNKNDYTARQEIAIRITDKGTVEVLPVLSQQVCDSHLVPLGVNF
jgi:hypothetical protein